MVVEVVIPTVRAFCFATFSPIPFEVLPLAAVPIKNIRLIKILQFCLINFSASKKLYNIYRIWNMEYAKEGSRMEHLLSSSQI